MLRHSAENSIESCGAAARLPTSTCCRKFPRQIVGAAIQRLDSPEVLATFVECCSDDGSRIPQADAGQFGIVYCVAGAGWVRVDGQQHDLRSGQVLVLPSRQIYGCRSHSDDPWTIYRIHLDGRKVSSIHRMLTGAEPCSIFQIGRDLPTLAAIQTLYDAMRGDESIHLLTAFLATAKLVWRLAMLSQHPLNALNKEPRIYATVGFMDQRLGKRTSVTELARIAHLSRSRYAQVFKSEMGYSVLEYFIRTKMYRGADLLENSDEQVKGIASTLGFKDALYFSRQFRRVYGVYPTIFRSIMRQCAENLEPTNCTPKTA
jgi:AraC-like DNA-binding protein